MSTRFLSVIVKSIRSSGRGRKLAWAAGAIGFLVVSLLILDFITDNTAEQQVSGLVEEFNESGLVRVAYGRTDSSLFGGTITVSDIGLEAFGSTLDIGELVLYDYTLNEQGLLVVLKAQLRDFTLDPESLFPPGRRREAFLRMLSGMGYTGPAEGDVFVDWAFHEEDQLTDLRRISLDIDDFGGFTLEGELFGLSAGALAVLMMGMENTLPIRIGSLELEYRDDSFLTRALRYFAEQQGRDSVDALIDDLLLQWEQDQGLQVLFAGELERFLRNPRSLRLAIHPESPVTMPQIGATGSPQELADLLNVQLEGN